MNDAKSAQSAATGQAHGGLAAPALRSLRAPYSLRSLRAPAVLVFSILLIAASPALANAALPPEVPEAPAHERAAQEMPAVPEAEAPEAAAPATETAATAAPIPPELIMSAGLLVDGLQFDIPIPWGNPDFEKARAQYLSPGGRAWIVAVMKKALPFIAWVEERIAYYELPMELAFLPVIESEYSPLAVSGSGAAGLWQFMRGSIAGYGMSIDEWKDERRDFMKSTDGALRLLRDNYRATGDWYLALAAYNAGLGAVTRALKSLGSESAGYLDLVEAGKLGKEPSRYVPKFLAIASILRYPALHGLPSAWGEAHAWAAVETLRQVDLQVLAERAQIPLATLKTGNAELRYAISPPDTKHLIKVPADKADTVRSILADTSKPLIRYSLYKVKAGDTLSHIAAQYNSTVAIILKANPGIKAEALPIGTTLTIPAYGK